jgi:hypothetical protein
MGAEVKTKKGEAEKPVVVRKGNAVKVHAFKLSQDAQTAIANGLKFGTNLANYPRQ